MSASRPALLDTGRMRDSAAEVVRLLKALGNEDRLMLLCELSRGERCVTELEQALDIRQPTLSQQLGVLREEGLVTGRRDGKRVYYAVTDPDALHLLGTLYRRFCPGGPAPGTE